MKPVVDIGDPVKVHRLSYSHDIGTVTDEWVPATVVAVQPGDWLVVAYVDGTHHKIEWRSKWSLQ